MKTLEELILQARRESRNADNSNTTASDSIGDVEFIQWYNDAQARQQSIVSSVFPDEFITEKIINIVARQEDYEIADRVYLNSRIHSIEYSYNRDARYYRPLPFARLKERSTRDGEPAHYHRRGKKILVNPIPMTSQGSLRINYERELDSLDIRRAKVDTTVSGTITSIALDNANFPTNADLIAAVTGSYVCISDAEGNVTAYNIPVTSVTSTAITVPSHTLADGETITENSFVTLGRYTTFVPKAVSERHLLAYVIWRAMLRDVNSSHKEKEVELTAIEKDLTEAYSHVSRDVEFITILDEDNL